MQQIDHSLDRFGNRLRSSNQSPLGIPHIIEENMDALYYLVKAGKVRYLGASAMYA